LFTLSIHFLFDTFCDDILKGDARAFRWDERVIHWALSLQYSGGTKTLNLLNLLRGDTSSSTTHGNLPIEVYDRGLFLPPQSTLLQNLPIVDSYPTMNIAKIAGSLVGEGRTGGLTFDEMFWLYPL
jgi:hypothetical protein